MAIPISLQGKVALGAAAFGAYEGDILNDPVGGTLNAGIFGATATLMKITPTNLKEDGKVVTGLNVDPVSIRQQASLGVSEADAKDIQRVKNRIIQLESNLKYQAQIEAKYQQLLQQRAQYEPNARTKRIRRLDKRIVALQQQLSLSTVDGLNAYSASIATKLKQFGIHLGGSFNDLKSFTEGITDANMANKLWSLLKNGTPYAEKSLKRALHTTPTSLAVIQTTDRAQAEQALIDYFKSKLNNPANIATQKAERILDRAISGQNITIKDHTLSFIDSINKSRVSLPLTAQTKDGVFYHAPNSSTFFAVSGTNPYAEALTRKNTPVNILGTDEIRPVNLGDALERMHPELMVLNAYEGKDITSGLDIIRKQLHHSEKEGATQLRTSLTLDDADVSARFRDYGTSINRGMVLNTNAVGQIDSNQPLRPINVVSTHAGAMSEAKAAQIALQEAMIEAGMSPEHLKQGLSLNNTHGISTSEYQTIAPLNMEQRAVVNRSTQATNKTDAYKQMAEIYGDDFLKQFESSVMLNKIDILDKASFNKIMASNLGSEYVLADGAGLFNLKDSHLFEHGTNQSIKISPQKNGSLILENKHLKDIFDSFDSYVSTNKGAKLDDSFLELYKDVIGLKRFNDQLIKKGKAPIINQGEQFNDIAARFVKGDFDAYKQQINQLKSPITFRAGTRLGIDGSNNAVSIHRQYSQAELKGMALSPEGDLVLHTNSVFNPKKEGIVKLFSEASKSNLVGTDNFDFAAAVGHMLNSGSITSDKTTGKFYFNDSVNYPIATQLEVNLENIRRYVKALRATEKTDVKSLGSKDRSVLEAVKSRSILLASEDTGMGGFIKTLNPLRELPPDPLNPNLVKYRWATSADIYQDLAKGSKISFSAESINKLKTAVEQVNDPKQELTNARKTAILAGMLGNFKASTDITATVASNIFTNLDRVLTNGAAASKDQLMSTGRMLQQLGYFKPSAAALKDPEQFRNELLNNINAIPDKTKFKEMIATRFKSAISLESLSQAASQNDALLDLARFTSGLSGSNLLDLVHGNISTLGNLNVGQAILGIGNRARMSWTATHQLLNNGLSKQELSAFGEVNEKLLLELEGLFGERSSSIGNRFNSLAINNKISVSDFPDVLNILENKKPEQRLAELTARGIELNPDAKFITYNLQHRYKDLARLNFATVTTPRSGFFDKDERAMMKETEGLRLSLLRQDQLIIEASNSVDKRAHIKKYEELADRYIQLTNKSLRGDNSLLKAAFSRYSDASNIDLVRGVGGEAFDYIEHQKNTSKSLANGLFVTEEGLNYRLKLAGIDKKDLVEQKIGKSLSKFSYKTASGELVPLQALLTREPSQGPLSSTLEDIILDRSMTSKSTHAFLPENHQAFTVGKYMDFDQDTLQELIAKYESTAQADSVNAKFKNVSEILKDLVDMHGAIKVKSKSSMAHTPLDFNDYTEAARFKAAAAAQGRERKVLAAPSTAIAVDLSEALTLQFGEGSSKAVRGRFLAHALVENLLKSAHVETSKYQQQTESEIEKLTRLKKEFLAVGDKKKYAEQLKPIYMAQLNLADMSKLDPRKAQLLEGTVDDLVEAEVNQAKKLSLRAITPLDVTTPRQGSTIVDRAIEASEAFLETEKAFDLQSSKSYAKLAKEFKLNLGKTLSDNKGILALGLGASVLGSIVGRQGTPVATSGSTDVDRFIRDDPSANLRPARTVPTGIETNKQTRAYVTPKNHTKNKNIEIEGQFVNTIVDPIGATQDLSSAIFGDSIRMARLETQYN